MGWNKKHGHADPESPEYKAWTDMKRRCLNPRTPNFKYYGALGVQVCDQWLTDFGAFLAEVGLRPSPRHSLDRWPNSHGNYEPGNVRWATRSEQEQNKGPHRMCKKGLHLLDQVNRVSYGGHERCKACWREWRRRRRNASETRK